MDSRLLRLPGAEGRGTTSAYSKWFLTRGAVKGHLQGPPAMQQSRDMDNPKYMEAHSSGREREVRQWHQCDSHGGVLCLGKKFTSQTQKDCIVTQ